MRPAHEAPATESPQSRRQIECINPATGEALGTVAAAQAKDVAAAVERARIAQIPWAATGFRQRRQVLERLLDRILRDADWICQTVVSDSGKTFENAMLGEILPVANKLRWMIRNAEKHLRPEKVSSGLLLHKTARIEYRPLGVVGCIVPWNYPFQNIVSSLVAPLMAGNAVIVKASEAVAWSSQQFGELIGSVLEECGVSADTVQVINGYGDTGAALVRGGVQKILFIGSVPNGRRIIEGSAQSLTPVILELGGKDPLIVCDDADLEHAVHSALGGCFVNLGQNCIAAERILVHAGIHDRFVARVGELAGALSQAVPTAPAAADTGAINTRMQLELIEELVSDALAQGARALVGGQASADTTGQFYPPTVLVDVRPEMRIAKEEVFGPVMLIFRVSSDEEAVQLANATPFGLQASVLSGRGARAEAIAARLEAGGVVINDYGLGYLIQDLPFGGVKQSGFGRMNGRDGLRAYTNAKAVVGDRIPMRVPPRLFPVRGGDYERSRTLVRLLYAPRWRDRLRALGQLLTGRYRHEPPARK